MELSLTRSEKALKLSPGSQKASESNGPLGKERLGVGGDVH